MARQSPPIVTPSFQAENFSARGTTSATKSMYTMHRSSDTCGATTLAQYEYFFSLPVCREPTDNLIHMLGTEVHVCDSQVPQFQQCK